MKFTLSSFGAFAGWFLGSSLAWSGVAVAAKVEFNRDVRPILSDACFHCHGPDEKERKAGLRLDVRAEALRAAKSGEPAIVPGQPEKSELLKRLYASDAEEVMPPPKVHKVLSAAQKELLRRWIAEGAEYQGHWAFLPPRRVEVPMESANPVDGFVRHRLQGTGLQPAPEAPKEVLLRRVSLDLTGLPPGEAEADAFLKDSAPGAYERLVDRLLASPRYGEHMAAAWLDLARYADSNGFQTDSSRQMWPWRDWVIQAYNQNKPFDQFTIEQLAGDLLPQPERGQLIATGFNRNHRLNGEGGRIVEEWFAETVIDRVETTGLTWMALTLNCSRCHDHKYDPISQKEFYQLFAYFNSNDETGVLEGVNSRPVLTLSTPEEEARLGELAKAELAAASEVARIKKEMLRLQTDWEVRMLQETNDAVPEWVPLEKETAKSKGGASLARLEDGSWLAGGRNAPNDEYEFEAPLAKGSFSGVLLEVLPHQSLPNQSLGRGANGNFVLTQLEAELVVPGKEEAVSARFVRADADYSQKNYEASRLVAALPAPQKGKGGKQAPVPPTGGGWAVDGNRADMRVPRRAFFACERLDVPEGASVRIRLRHGSGFGDHNIGRLRLSVTGRPTALVGLSGKSFGESLRSALMTEKAKRSKAQADEVEKAFVASGEHPLAPAEANLNAAKTAVSDFKSKLVSTMIFRELPAPRQAAVLKRGEYDKPGEAVERALPAVLPPLPAGAPNNRLGLAQWLVSGEHPLTARVWVNREWERFFGTGLVRTTENLGSQSEWPSHPELLDWLATEFVRLKWDMKAMQRLLVTSATYRQSSRVGADHLAKDPENRLLARASRLRLPAEAMRDQALALGGLLVEKTGGPSVRPYMPEAVWDETSKYGDLRNYKADTGEGLYRRTLYTIWKRTAAPPTMLLFDSPNREICTVKRTRSNTPTQALALLNEVTYVEAARKLAEAMLLQGGSTPEQRVAWAFRRVTGRSPETPEVERLLRGLYRRVERMAGAPDVAAQILSVGESKPAGALAASELAAYTVTANVLLNLDEVLTRP